MKDHVVPVTRCRCCGGGEFRPVLDLGVQAPANALLSKAELAQPEGKYPLAIMGCVSCELIQLTHIVEPELLFRNYVYFSSQSTTMREHFKRYAADIADAFVPTGGLVVELGSNDGILLRTLLGRPVRVLGVDPASNVAKLARVRGVNTIDDFFTLELAKKIRAEQGPAHAIIANNVFAHIDNIGDVVEGVAHLLDDAGVFSIEAPYVVDFLEHLEFDTIYHEHLSYLGVRPLARLFERYGFEVFDVQHQPGIHGGSIRVLGARRGVRAKTPRVDEMLARETSSGVADPARLARFATQVAALRDELRALVGRLRAEGRRVVGYTAPAKGNVLLNYCGLGPDAIEYMADSTPAKQDLFSPGMHIPIVSPEKFRADRPDYALLFAWNLKTEILAKEQAWRDAGGKFIIPVPKIEIV